MRLWRCSVLYQTVKRLTHSLAASSDSNPSEGQRGWIVPIATGFHGISELGSAQNQRDPETPHRFAEAVVTLGEFTMPYHLESIEDLLWHYHYDAENNLYLCQHYKHDTIEGF